MTSEYEALKQSLIDKGYTDKQIEDHMLQIAWEHEDRLIALHREREDRKEDLLKEIQDATSDREHAERYQDALGMAKAQRRIDAARKELETLVAKSKPESD